MPTKIIDCYISIPKIGDELFSNIICKILNNYEKLQQVNDEQIFLYYHNAPRYFTRATDFQPHFWNEKDGEKLSVSVKTISCSSSADSKIICDILNSNIFYLWFIMLSDCRHLNPREIYEFSFNISNVIHDIKTNLISLCKALMKDYIKNRNRKHTIYRATGEVEYDEYFPKFSKPIIDEIDTVLARHYGFTEEELDFIINYDIKYRMGDELNDSED